MAAAQNVPKAVSARTVHTCLPHPSLLTVLLLLSTLPKLQVLCQPPTLHYVVAWWSNAANESWILWETEESPA